MSATPATTRPVKAPKPTEAELAQQARVAIADAHLESRFDLQHERWIPVLRNGSVEHVGLRELLLSAHTITDLAIAQPLQRAGMRRFLEALTADLVRHASHLDTEAWEDAHGANTGFAISQVDQLLARHSGHLWLWHPVSPFLQDPRLAAVSVKPQDDLPIQDMNIYLPAGSSLAWWVKAGEPALDGGLSPGETALALVARWFYAANGNCGRVTIGTDASGNNLTTGSQAGGSFSETVATVTHAFRLDATSLFRSLLRGMPRALITATPGKPEANGAHFRGCAWLDPHQPQISNDALYMATLNSGAVLLTAHDDTDASTRWLRGSTPIAGEVAKAVRDAAKDADAHRIGITFANGKTSPVKIAPSSIRVEAVQRFHRDALAARQLTGVASSSDCFVQVDPATLHDERLELFLVSKGGTGSSPVWQDIAGLELPARYVDPNGPDFATIAATVAIAFDPHDGVQQRLERAVSTLLAIYGPTGWKPPPRDEGLYPALRDKTVNAWLAEVSIAFDDALDIGDVDTAEAATQWQRFVFRAAREAFDDVVGPYLTSSRYASQYALALRHLQRKGLS